MITAMILALAVTLPDLSAVEPQVREAIVAAAANADAETTAAAHGALGMSLHAHGFIDSAVAAYVAAARLDREDYRWPYLAGHASLERDPAGAAVHLQRAVSLNPSDYALAIELGEVLTQLGRLDEADAAFQVALELDPTRGFAALGLARIAFARGNLEKAIDSAEQARDRLSRDLETHLLLAQLYARNGDTTKADLAMRRSRAHPIRKVPASKVIADMLSQGVDSDALRVRGQARLQSGDVQGAITVFHGALAVRPDDLDTRRNLAAALARTDAPEARHEFDKILQANPDDARTLLAMGRAFGDRSFLVQAVESDPFLAAARLELGRMDGLLGIENIERAVELDPSLYPELFLLGERLLAAGRERAAAGAFLDLLELDPADPRPVSALQTLAATTDDRDLRNSIQTRLRSTFR